VPEAVSRETADHRFALKLVAWILGLWLIGLALLFEAAALPPEGSGTVIALFPPRMSAAESLAASATAGAKLVSISWFDNVLVVADAAPGFVGRLQDQGAIAVFRNMRFAGISFAGCVGATLPKN
jgi:uncharacterized membrane protein SpoIIM required for sporulation